MPVSKINATAVVEPQILSKRIVWNTVMDYMIGDQDDTGNIINLGPPSYKYPKKIVNKLFNEELTNWYGTYFSPVIFGDISKISDNPKTFLSTIPTEFNGIPFARVFKSVIKKISKSIDGNVSAFNFKRIDGSDFIVLNSCYFKTDFSFRLRPRIPITDAEYASIITAWDSSTNINENIAQKLDYISRRHDYEPEQEFNGPVFPESYYFPIKPVSAPVNLDPNYPHVIVATSATITIDYYWR